jgi:hypothetical protein
MRTDSETVTQKIKQKVFISYSRKDIKFARRLATDLENAGFDVWWDISDLQGGDDWVRFIPAAIETSRFFVVLLSPDSVKSEWVSKEYSYALRLRKKIVPAMIRQCDVPFALNTINYVDFINAEYATAVNKLLVALGSEPLPEMPVTGLKKFYKKLPPVFTKNPFFSIGAIIVLFAILLFAISNPFIPVTPPPSDTPTTTSTPTLTPRPTDLDTDTPTPTPSQTFTPTVSATPSITPTKTPAPVNFVLPTVCVQPTQPNIQAVWVRSGPGTDRGVLLSAPAIEVGKCPLIGGQNEGEDWLMIAYDQSDPEYVQYEGGWVSKDLFDLSTPVFIPEITLTPTPTITFTPTITPTFTATLSPTPTSTYTNTPTRTYTPTATDTLIPTSTFTPTLEPEETNTP